ncbi:MAG: FAD-dependent thymidylate synthase [Acidobacteriaceae bacterium]|nr:FAD-dependent thymidylate synthase [Acidobacteriaceae bacterium]MBV9780807.1 FAD-dependent thymidylate synthase [Acidobacteriaceae bacterium]
MSGSPILQPSSRKRVLSVAPMPAEKLAYALARYSRSPDSIAKSLEWVRSHDSARFLESFYFQYGHASIADLGHVAVCFEGISELAAAEIEDEQLWDGQARSSRYQDFSSAGVIVPPELTASEIRIYEDATARLRDAYRTVHQRAVSYYEEQLPQPAAMKPETYRRNIAARAFDVARYLLPFGSSTGVGQVTSIRTLEKQIRRLKASEFQEIRELADELTGACASAPECAWNGHVAGEEALAPTLARHADRDEYTSRLRADLTEWASHRLPAPGASSAPPLDLMQPADSIADICATLLYSVTDRPYRELYELACGWHPPQKQELLSVALGARSRRDELPRQFRSAPYVFDFTMDVGAYRDLHRHRRCQQFRQQYTNRLGYETPELLAKCGAEEVYREALREADAAIEKLPQPAAQYLLPFAARSRFLFKMDFAELEYISRLRSGVKGHFSYRKIAWEMKQALERLDPALGTLVEVTPPWIEDPLNR